MCFLRFVSLSPNLFPVGEGIDACFASKEIGKIVGGLKVQFHGYFLNRHICVT